MRHLMDHSRRRAGLRLVRPLILPFALIGAVLVEPVACLAQGQESTTSAMGPQTQAHPVAVGSTISVTSVPAGPMIPGSPGSALAAPHRVDERAGAARAGRTASAGSI